MPSRGLSIAIIAFWLGMTTWMFLQDIWPYLQPGVPPPYIIDLVDEAGMQKQNVRHRDDDYPNEVKWKLYQQGSTSASTSPEAHVTTAAGLLLVSPLHQPSYVLASLIVGNLDPYHPIPFMARTWVEYREKPDDSFTFGFMLVPSTVFKVIDLGKVKLKTMRSEFRVNRAGQLLDTKVVLSFDGKFLWHRFDNVGFHLEGKVFEGLFHARFRVFSIRDEVASVLSAVGHSGTLPALGLVSWTAEKKVEQAPFRFDYQFKPVPVARTGSVLNPLHPVNRIKGLRPGQTWRMPLLDPVAKAQGALEHLLGKNDAPFLNARVLPQPQMLPDHPSPIPCLVIEYDDEETRPRTWVQVGSGLVLRQEASQLGRRMILQRDNITPEP